MSEPKGPPVLDEGTARRPSKKASSSKKAAAPSAGDATAASPGPSAPSAALGPAQAIGPPTVPRIPLETAEPKTVVQGDAKPRASKKRTSVAPSEPSGPPPSFEAATGTARATRMGPTSVAPDAAIAVAKVEADAAAAARRETKKQRAREIEEQKRREELERRAAAEQRRLEEQRKREERQRQQQAALNANAEECQEEAEEQNEYEDDGFENYDDDGFEADEISAPPKPAVTPLKPMSAKANAKSRGSTPQAGGGDLTGRELEKIQHALQVESKELLSTFRPSSSSTPDASRPQVNQTGSKSTDHSGSATSSTISSSIAGLKQALDPRAKRIKEILEARKSLDVDKFYLFQQNPVSEQDKLMQRLRRGAVRQGIVQTSEGARAQATQTKPPPSADKSMHFPDDIGLDSSSVASISARNTPASDNNAEEQATASASSSLSSSSRFFKFLEHAAYACEVLVVENIMAAEKLWHDQAEAKFSGNADGSANQSKDIDIVPAQKRFEMTSSTPIGAKLVCPATNESKETEPLPSLQRAVQGRSLTALHFSPVVSNLLLACYVDDGGISDEAKADSKRTDDHDKEAKATDRQVSHRGKTLSCVWDVNQPSRPLHVLKNEGATSAAMLSPTRELFVLAGSTDGSIYVWDLRQNALMATQSSPIFMDGVAICAPIYSTCGASVRATNLLSQSHSPQQEHHASSIVSIEPIVRATPSSSSGAGSSSVAGGNFQFGSMDDRGVLIVWSLVELDADDETLVADKCAEIGARVKLVMNARIDTQRMYITPPPSNLPANGRRTSGSSLAIHKGADAKSATSAAKSTQMLGIGPIASVVKFLPHDPNQFVVGTHTGMLLRGHRFEQNQKGPAALASFRAFYRRDGKNGGLLRGLGSTTSISSLSSAGVTSIAFHPLEPGYFLVGFSDGGICLFHCETPLCLSAWDEASFGVEVSSVAWSPSRPAVFFAAFDDAHVRVWDLLENTTAPVITHMLDPPDASPLSIAPLYLLALSAEHVRTSRPSVAWPSAASPLGFAVHELSNALAVPAKRERAATAKLLECII